MDPLKNSDSQKQKQDCQPRGKQCDRRDFLKGAAKFAALGGAAMLSGCGSDMLGSKEELPRCDSKAAETIPRQGYHSGDDCNTYLHA